MYWIITYIQEIKSCGDTEVKTLKLPSGTSGRRIQYHVVDGGTTTIFLERKLNVIRRAFICNPIWVASSSIS